MTKARLSAKAQKAVASPVERHPLAARLEEMLNDPSKASLGDLAQLLNAVNAELGFYEAAMKAEPAHAGSGKAKGELDASEIKLLGTLLARADA